MNAERILWIDPHSVVDAWTPINELRMESPVIISLGLVVTETEQNVAVSVGYNPEVADVCTTLIIPKCNILEREVILKDADVF